MRRKSSETQRWNHTLISRPAERRPSAPSVAALRHVILSLALMPFPWTAAAQVAPSLGQDRQVGAAISVRSGVAWLSRRPLPILAVSGTLRLSTTVEVGGEGVIGLGAVRLSSKDPADRSELETSYGGALVRWRPAGDALGVRWGWGLLLGAGSARIQSPLAEGPVLSENYFLIDPRFDLLVRQDRSLRFFAEAGYRIAFGADPLPGIRIAELRGPTLSLAAQYVRDP